MYHLLHHQNLSEPMLKVEKFMIYHLRYTLSVIQPPENRTAVEAINSVHIKFMKVVPCCFGHHSPRLQTTNSYRFPAKELAASGHNCGRREKTSSLGKKNDVLTTKKVMISCGDYF